MRTGAFTSASLVVLTAIGAAPAEYVGISGVAIRATILSPLYLAGIIDAATFQTLTVY